MKTPTSSTSIRRAFAALVLVSAFGATQALAECDETQEAQTGKAIAQAASTAIAKVIPAQGKQMVNLETCEASSGGIVAEFKYNVLTADGLYWASGRARVSAGAVGELKLLHLSPNLSEASAKSGVKLAAN